MYVLSDRDARSTNVHEFLQPLAVLLLLYCSVSGAWYLEMQTLKDVHNYLYTAYQHTYRPGC